MKNHFKLLVSAVILSCVFLFSSCGGNVEIDPYDITRQIDSWKFQENNYGNERKVLLTVTEDIDYLFWTKFTGEVIYSDRSCKMGDLFYGNEKLSFAKREEPYIFDFSGLEDGTYVLNIHYKDTAKNTDFDYRGFINISGTVSVVDKVNGKYGGAPCPKQARFTIRNDSSALLKNIHKKDRPGNVMNEFIYVDYESNESYYDYTYKTKIKFKYITLAPGKTVDVLLPMGRNDDVCKNGFLLKKVINDGETIYYGNTNTGIYKNGFGSPMGGAINNDFIPKEDGKFYSDWNWRH